MDGAGSAGSRTSPPIRTSPCSAPSTCTPTTSSPARYLVQRRTPPAPTALYQVPLAERPGAEDGIELGDSVVVDGPRDARLGRRAARRSRSAAARPASEGGVAALGTRLGWLGPPPAVTARPGALRRAVEHLGHHRHRDARRRRRPAVMVKVFRALHHGENPDVVLQSAIAGRRLAAACPRRTARSLGDVAGRRPRPTAVAPRPPRRRAGVPRRHAGRLARRARRGARRRGLHRSGPRPRRRDRRGARRARRRAADACRPTTAARRALLDGMRARGRAGRRAVPSARRIRSERIDAVLVAPPRPATGRRSSASTATTTSARCCRCPDRGWVLLDFEGEPLRPMAERSEPDLAAARRRRHAPVVRLRRRHARARGRRRRRPPRLGGRGPRRVPRRLRRRARAAPSRRTPRCSPPSSSTRRSTSASTRRATGPAWLPIPERAVLPAAGGPSHDAEPLVPATPSPSAVRRAHPPRRHRRRRVRVAARQGRPGGARAPRRRRTPTPTQRLAGLEPLRAGDLRRDQGAHEGDRPLRARPARATGGTTAARRRASSTPATAARRSPVPTTGRRPQLEDDVPGEQMLLDDNVEADGPRLLLARQLRRLPRRHACCSGPSTPRATSATCCYVKDLTTGERCPT